MGKPIDLVQGSLDFLILRTIELEPKYGWAIAKRIEQISGDTLQIRQGSRYPALYPLERQYCEMCVPADLVRIAKLADVPIAAIAIWWARPRVKA